MVVLCEILRQQATAPIHWARSGSGDRTLASGWTVEAWKGRGRVGGTWISFLSSTLPATRPDRDNVYLAPALARLLAAWHSPATDAAPAPRSGAELERTGCVLFLPDLPLVEGRRRHRARRWPSSITVIVVVVIIILVSVVVVVVAATPATPAVVE